MNDAPLPELGTDSSNDATETKPLRMLEIIAFASLDVVGTENFLRYGPTGPLRYVKGIPEGHNSPQNLHAALELKSAWENANAITHNITFWRTYHEQGEKAVWASNDRGLRAQMMWVWDFYRMLSYFQMRVEQSTENDKATGDWAALLKELQNINEEGALTLRVTTKSGEILQRHTLKSPKPVTIDSTPDAELTGKKV